jgi:hypothetical protein
MKNRTGRLVRGSGFHKNMVTLLKTRVITGGVSGRKGIVIVIYQKTFLQQVYLFTDMQESSSGRWL